MLHSIATSLIVFITGAGFAGSPAAEPSTPTAVASQEAPMSLPASWEEFVASRMEMGNFGDWTTTGTTEAMWEGIPSGLKYTSTESTQLSSDGSYMTASHIMRTDDGKVMSIGGGIICWDAQGKKVIGSYSGFDFGTPFSGPRTLLGMNGMGEKWNYVETSGGKTTSYVSTTMFTGFNTQSNSVQRRDGSGPKQSTTMTRANAMDHIKKYFDVAGTWEQKTENGMTMVTTSTWGFDGRGLFSTEGMRLPDGSIVETGESAMWWDGLTSSFRTHYLNNVGIVVMGEVTSFTVDGDTTTMVVMTTGSNAAEQAITAAMTQVLKGETLTVTFSDMRVNGRPMTPKWAEKPMVTRRVSKN
jgi:hypothetical protein